MLQESDSPLAERLLRSGMQLLLPDFWLVEASNVLWLQVRRKIFTPDEALEGLSVLEAVVRPTRTSGMALHDVALDIGLAVDHSPYDTMYVAFALAMGATSVVVADRGFMRDMRRHPDAAVAGMLISLEELSVTD